MKKVHLYSLISENEDDAIDLSGVSEFLEKVRISGRKGFTDTALQRTR